MNGNWGYNRADKNFKSATTLIRRLADIASKGGNLLLNVGPTADGEIPPESVERLEAIGRWMDQNGESIHGTEEGPFPVGALPWGRATQRALDAGQTRVYLHVFDWPADGTLVVPGLRSEPARAFLLADPQQRPLTVARRGDALAISVPAARPDEHDAVVVVDVAGWAGALLS
jgi:alpha-L-fucosidase